MSKLSDAINAELIPDKRKAVSNTKTFTATYNNEMVELFSTEYFIRASIGVNFKQDIWVKKEDWFNSDIRDEIVRNIKEAMVEEIFGEFRSTLKEIRLATYEEDNNKVRVLVNKLYEQMFKI